MSIELKTDWIYPQQLLKLVTARFHSPSPKSLEDRIIDSRGITVTIREWGQYPGLFLLPRSPEYWQGKTILDVGSGNKWTDPNITFPGAKVCAIDPEFGEGGEIESNTAHETKPGIVQEIPYADDTFDLVVSSHAVPYHVSFIESPEALFEMARVIKETSELGVRLTPCVRHYHITQEFEERLTVLGFRIEYLHGETGAALTVIHSGF